MARSTALLGAFYSSLNGRVLLLAGRVLLL